MIKIFILVAAFVFMAIPAWAWLVQAPPSGGAVSCAANLTATANSGDNLTVNANSGGVFTCQ